MNREIGKNFNVGRLHHSATRSYHSNGTKWHLTHGVHELKSDTGVWLLSCYHQGRGHGKVIPPILSLSQQVKQATEQTDTVHVKATLTHEKWL